MYSEEVEMLVKDPVCGMQIQTEDAVGSSEYQGQTYYFCSEDCKESFDQNPEKYVHADHSQHGGHH
jgi:Cu+-exporting ATPase